MNLHRGSNAITIEVVPTSLIFKYGFSSSPLNADQHDWMIVCSLVTMSRSPSSSKSKATEERELMEPITPISPFL
jgi:hypothetical protein